MYFDIKVFNICFSFSLVLVSHLTLYSFFLPMLILSTYHGGVNADADAVAKAHG